MPQEDYLSHYAQYQAEQDSISYARETSRNTGFSNIDSHMSGFPICFGLLVASSSVGKTAFVVQLADQLAQQGENVILICYEADKLEIWSRLMSRRIKIADPSSTLSTEDIRRHVGQNTPIFQQVNQEFYQSNLQLRMWMPDNTKGIPWIIHQLTQTMREEPHLKKPIVIVDYVQILPHKGDIKGMLDREIPKLRYFQMQTNCTILLVSATSRSNYYKNLSMDSAKESGVLESSANLMWTLQYSVLDKQTADPLTGDEVEEYKRQEVRQMTLRCLKQRSGEDFDAYFNYYPRFEWFVPREKSPTPRKSLKER